MVDDRGLSSPAATISHRLAFGTRSQLVRFTRHGLRVQTLEFLRLFLELTHQSLGPLAFRPLRLGDVLLALERHV